MKRLLCVFSLLMVFLLAVPAYAESHVIPADDDDLKSMIEKSLNEVAFDYSNVTLNRERKIIVVDVAFDGITEQLLALKTLGADENLEDWQAIKSVFLSMYSAFTDMFKTVHREDMRLILQLVNDDAFMREDYSTILYNPLLSIGIFGTVDIDILGENY